MNDERQAQHILYALFQLSRETRHISAATLAAAAHTTATAAARALVDLERAGLVDATRARLTMAGLIEAAQLDAAGGGGATLDLDAAEDATPPTADAQVPVAARSVPPQAPAMWIGAPIETM